MMRACEHRSSASSETTPAETKSRRLLLEMALVVLLLAHRLDGRAREGVQASFHVELLCSREGCKGQTGEVQNNGAGAGFLPGDFQVLVKLNLQPDPEVWPELACGPTPCDLELCGATPLVIAAVGQEVAVLKALQQS